MYNAFRKLNSSIESHIKFMRDYRTRTGLSDEEIMKRLRGSEIVLNKVIDYRKIGVVYKSSRVTGKFRNLSYQGTSRWKEATLNDSKLIEYVIESSLVSDIEIGDEIDENGYVYWEGKIDRDSPIEAVIRGKYANLNSNRTEKIEEMKMNLSWKSTTAGYSYSVKEGVIPAILYAIVEEYKSGNGRYYLHVGDKAFKISNLVDDWGIKIDEYRKMLNVLDKSKTFMISPNEFRIDPISVNSFASSIASGKPLVDIKGEHWQLLYSLE